MYLNEKKFKGWYSKVTEETPATDCNQSTFCAANNAFVVAVVAASF